MEVETSHTKLRIGGYSQIAQRMFLNEYVCLTFWPTCAQSSFQASILGKLKLLNPTKIVHALLS